MAFNKKIIIIKKKYFNSLYNFLIKNNFKELKFQYEIFNIYFKFYPLELQLYQ